MGSVIHYAQFEHLVAGLSGGLVSTLVVHPLDLLKIRFAVNEGDGSVRPQPKGYWAQTKDIVGSRGLRGLYQGAVPNLLGNTVAWGLYFQFYNVCKSCMRQREDEDLSANQHLAAGVIAGVGTLTVTNPIWVMKTRLCLQYEGQQKQFSGFLDALVKTYKAQGIRGWYKGYLPGLIGTSHGALQFMAYDEMKKQFCRYKNRKTSEKLGSAEYIIFAGSSKLFAVSCTYPYQVVRARLQDQHRAWGGVMDVIRGTFRGEGIKGFYKGILPSLARVIPATCITFLVYENVSHYVRSLLKDT